jgi:hypothetical protein
VGLGNVAVKVGTAVRVEGSTVKVDVKVGGINVGAVVPVGGITV